jgi:hypothetical protein
MFAVGHERHHIPICSGSVVALRWPCFVRGCLPGDPQSGRPQLHLRSAQECTGKTANPRAPRASAASQRVMTPDHNARRADSSNA